MKIFFEWKLKEGECTGCGICRDVCPSSAIKMSRQMAYPEPIVGKCEGCLDCVKECPFDAIEVKRIENESFLQLENSN